MSKLNLDDYQYLPSIIKFKVFVELLRKSINNQLQIAGYKLKVRNIEEQYLYYEKGGRFERHRDT